MKNNNIGNVSDEALVTAAQNGDDNALSEILTRYEGLVRSKASLYYVAGADEDDVIQEGRIFEIDELVYSYYTGELEIFLRRAGKRGEADAVAALSTHNAFILVELYKILGLDPKMTEEEIRRTF